MGIGNFFKKVVGGLSKALNVIAPIAAFIPGLQIITVAAMAMNVANGLMQKPPDWKGILTNVAMQAIPMGLGKAIQAFKGGTSLEFAKLLTGKFGDTLGEVAKRVNNPQFTQMIGSFTTRLQNPESLSRIAQLVNKATNTRADAILNQAQLSRSAMALNVLLQPVMRNVAGTVTAPITQAQSRFEPTPMLDYGPVIDNVPGWTRPEREGERYVRPSYFPG